MVKEQFCGDGDFRRQVQLAHGEFMNSDVAQYQMAEILAAYTDKILKKGSHKELAKSIEELIDQQVELFSFVIDKDLYFEVFRNYLARRLLQDKSEDMEAEKLIITNMKVNCGMA